MRVNELNRYVGTERFVESSRFAKVVDTAGGPAILIAGEVIGISSCDPERHVEWITTALRRAGSESCQMDPSSEARSRAP